MVHGQSQIPYCGNIPDILVPLAHTCNGGNTCANIKKYTHRTRPARTQTPRRHPWSSHRWAPARSPRTWIRWPRSRWPPAGTRRTGTSWCGGGVLVCVCDDFVDEGWWLDGISRASRIRPYARPLRNQLTQKNNNCVVVVVSALDGVRLVSSSLGLCLLAVCALLLLLLRCSISNAHTHIHTDQETQRVALANRFRLNDCVKFNSN